MMTSFSLGFPPPPPMMWPGMIPPQAAPPMPQAPPTQPPAAATADQPHTQGNFSVDSIVSVCHCTVKMVLSALTWEE